MSPFPPDHERCMAQKQDGLRCTRRVRRWYDTFRVGLCKQHAVEAEINSLFTTDATRALAWVTDRSTRKEQR